MQQVEITVSRRIRVGKNVSRRLRGKGKVPGIVYGLEKQAVPVEVDSKLMRTARESGDNAIFLLKMQGTDATRHVILKDVQSDPVTGDLLHVDFLRIDLTKPIEVEVPVRVTGTAAGIKEGGLLEFVHRTLRCLCLPTDIPADVAIDVTHLGMGQGVRAGEAKLPENVKLLLDPDTMLAVVHAPKAEEVPAAAAEVVAEEPEVIAKGKEAKEGAAPEKGEAKPGEAPKAEKAEKPEKAEKREREKK